MKYPYVTYDEDADALYVCLSDAEVAETRNLGDLRLIDYSADGAVVGVEFISVSQGVDLDGVPFGPTVAAAIGDTGLPIKIYA
jgi:uncharacterized protein YuzE